MKKMKTILLAIATVGILSGLALSQNNGDYRNHNHRDSDDYRWGQDRRTDAREYGMHLGYRDGFNQGRITRANNNNNNHDRNGRYNRNGSYNNRDYNYQYNNGNASPRNDTAGYQQWMGSRGQFKQGYRQGFATGFDDANNGRASQYNYVYGQNGQRTPWDPDGDGRPGVTVNNGNYGNYGNNGNYSNYGNWTNGGRGNGSATRFGAEDGQKAGQADRQSGHSSRPTEWESYRDADHGLSSSTGYSSSDQYKQEYRQAFMNEYNQAFGYRR